MISENSFFLPPLSIGYVVTSCIDSKFPIMNMFVHTHDWILCCVKIHSFFFDWTVSGNILYVSKNYYFRLQYVTVVVCNCVNLSL